MIKFYQKIKPGYLPAQLPGCLLPWGPVSGCDFIFTSICGSCAAPQAKCPWGKWFIWRILNSKSSKTFYTHFLSSFHLSYAIILLSKCICLLYWSPFTIPESLGEKESSRLSLLVGALTIEVEDLGSTSCLNCSFLYETGSLWEDRLREIHSRRPGGLSFVMEHRGPGSKSGGL